MKIFGVVPFAVLLFCLQSFASGQEITEEKGGDTVSLGTVDESSLPFRVATIEELVQLNTEAIAINAENTAKLDERVRTLEKLISTPVAAAPRVKVEYKMPEPLAESSLRVTSSNGSTGSNQYQSDVMQRLERLEQRQTVSTGGSTGSYIPTVTTQITSQPLSAEPCPGCPDCQPERFASTPRLQAFSAPPAQNSNFRQTSVTRQTTASRPGLLGRVFGGRASKQVESFPSVESLGAPMRTQCLDQYGNPIPCN